MPGRPAALLILIAALALGGCASGRVREANDYVSAVNKAQSSFAASSEQLLATLTPGGARPRERSALERYYTAADGFVARLQAIRPPARVRALHGRLIATMRDFVHSLRTAGAAIVSKNAITVLDGQQQLAQATAATSRTLNSTMSAINAKLRT